jgi:hypothetical protein
MDTSQYEVVLYYTWAWVSARERRSLTGSGRPAYQQFTPGLQEITKNMRLLQKGWLRPALNLY